MPIYEYACTICGREFEAVQKFSDPPVTECTCGQEGGVERKLSLSAFHLKGGGWYNQGYGSKAGSGNGNGSGDGAAKDAKSTDGAAKEGAKSTGTDAATAAKSTTEGKTGGAKAGGETGKPASSAG